MTPKEWQAKTKMRETTKLLVKTNGTKICENQGVNQSTIGLEMMGKPHLDKSEVWLMSESSRRQTNY